MDVKLYVVPGSHPCNTAQLMLEHKGIEYRRVDLIPLIARAYLRLRGFSGPTVPALEIDGRKIQGTLNMSRELDRIREIRNRIDQLTKELVEDLDVQAGDPDEGDISS